jgi:multidrug resistance efflux pump
LSGESKCRWHCATHRRPDYQHSGTRQSEVKAGDLLFEIDPADYKTALDSAKAAVANMEANLRQKQQDLERETELLQKNVSSRQEFQTAQNAFASEMAQSAAARSNLKQAELNLGYTKVYAPVDGYLTNVNTSPGAYVHAGDQLLALVDSSSFWIAAYFKETQLPSIKPDRTVKITLMGYRDQPFEGRVNSVAWGIFLQDGSGGTSTGLLAAVNQTVDCVRLPQTVSRPNPNYRKTSNSSQDRPDSHRRSRSRSFADAGGSL